jgi:hypothetical protein
MHSKQSTWALPPSANELLQDRAAGRASHGQRFREARFF